MLLLLLCAFIVASFTLYFLYPIAVKIGFVDRPSKRKLHQGDIPLIGGISVFLPIVIVLQIQPELIANSQVFVFCAACFLLIGLLDDKFDLSVKLRIILTSAISIFLVIYSDIKIHQLGDLVGWGNLTLNNFEILFNVIAIIGAITAFNMVDGLDGLLGGLAIVTLSALALLFAINEQYNVLLFCALIMVSLLPYIYCNLGLLPNKKRKVFMGDSGSLFIGFVVFWLFIESTQYHDTSPHINSLHPVTVLWLIAIPLMDMAYTMIRRIRKKQSPFKADREHIHHVCHRLGLSSTQTLMLICTFAILFASIGIIGEIYHFSEMIMFISFIIVFIGYYLCFTHIWKVSVLLRHVSNRF
ncbi:MAG: UDP-N-acetylglucosamine--undecaprenyl-phosphate N-acetylglucosaminephosphotransferase, partial [Psychromonas sp.]